MTVTRIEPCGKTRYRIHLDGEPAFILYKGEMKNLGIREGEEVSPDTLETIYSAILYRRARLRAMHLLEDMDRTEAGLREKLRKRISGGSDGKGDRICPFLWLSE